MNASPHDELEQLRDEHMLLDQKIDALSARPYLSPTEQMQRKRLQKLKLATKDRIAALEATLGER